MKVNGYCCSMPACCCAELAWKSSTSVAAVVSAAWARKHVVYTVYVHNIWAWYARSVKCEEMRKL